MKDALHFATKLNSRDIQKCNYFSVSSYDMFAFARKAVFPAPMVTGVHRLRKTWSSLLSQLVYNYGTRGEFSKGTSFTSRIQVHGEGPRNYNVQPRLVRGGVGEEVICHKKFQQSFLNQSLDPLPPPPPPSMKHLDPPLTE